MPKEKKKTVKRPMPKKLRSPLDKLRRELALRERKSRATAVAATGPVRTQRKVSGSRR
jgi:hypothetical protein